MRAPADAVAELRDAEKPRNDADPVEARLDIYYFLDAVGVEEALIRKHYDWGEHSI